MAIGEFAKPIYQLIDDYGGQDVSSTFILDELIRWMPGEDIAKFVEDFRREHDVRPANLFEDDDTDLFEISEDMYERRMTLQDRHETCQSRESDSKITENISFSARIPTC